MFNFLWNISVKKKLPVFSFLSISLGYWVRNEVSVEKNIGYFLYIDLSYTFLTHTEFIILFKLSKGDESSTLNSTYDSI